MKPGNPGYYGCSINLEIQWEDGSSITEQTLSQFMEDAPVDCALYAKEKGLLEVDGWRQLKPIAKREALLVRLV